MHASPARLAQLRRIGLPRNAVSESARELNRDLPAAVKGILEEILTERLKNTSQEDMDALQMKLKRALGVRVVAEEPAYGQFLGMVMNRVALPDYLRDWDRAKAKTEIDGVLTRVLGRADRLLAAQHRRPFTLYTGSERALRCMLDDGNDITFGIHPGGALGYVYFGPDETMERYCVRISVRVPMASKAKAGDPESTPLKTADEQAARKALLALFPSAGGKRKEGASKFPGFEADLRKEKNVSSLHGADCDSTYLVLRAWPTEAKEVTDQMGTERVAKILEGLTQICNEAVNAVAAATECGLAKQVRCLLVDTPLYTERDDDQEGDHRAQEREKKFSKLAVKMEPVPFDQVGGQPQAKEEAMKIVRAFKHEEAFRKWGARPASGVIFYGPSGTGKTLLAKAIASEIDAEVYNVRMTDIADSAYINEGANNVKDLFTFIRERAQKSEKKKLLVIFDEMDALLKKRGGRDQSAEDTKIVNTFLTEMNGFDGNGKVVFVGTTNYLESLDAAVTRSGRFGNKVKVELPDEKGRLEVLKIHVDKAKRLASGKAFAESLDLSAVAKASDGMSPADLEESVRRALETKANDEIVNGKAPEPVCAADLVRELTSINRTANRMSKVFPNLSPKAIDGLLEHEEGHALAAEAIGRVLYWKAMDELEDGLRSGTLTVPDLKKALETIERGPDNGQMGFAVTEPASPREGRSRPGRLAAETTEPKPQGTADA